MPIYTVSVLEMIFWAVPTLLIVLELFWEHDWKNYFRTCISNWLAIGFVFLAMLSLIWSIKFNITLYKVIVLMCSTFMAIYIGHIYRLEKILKSLEVFFWIISSLSLAMVLFYPKFGIMTDAFYKGAWNGIFWHRNYLGCFMALGIALSLTKILSEKKIELPRTMYYAGLFLFSTFMLIKSKSATGIITAFILVAFVFVLYAWVKLQHKLKRMHYFGFLAIAAVSVIVVLTNLGTVFGLLGRNTSLTGRIPMWGYVFEHLIFQRPWLGYGYGAIWHFQGIRVELAQIFNWGGQVMIGDNGFIDIWLHLGIAGLVVVLLLITYGFIHAIMNLLKSKKLEAAFPIVVLVFTLVANITLSLILESETFVWVIGIALIVSIKKHSDAPKTIQSN